MLNEPRTDRMRPRWQGTPWHHQGATQASCWSVTPQNRSPKNQSSSCEEKWFEGRRQWRHMWGLEKDVWSSLRVTNKSTSHHTRLLLKWDLAFQVNKGNAVRRSQLLSEQFQNLNFDSFTHLNILSQNHNPWKFRHKWSFSSGCVWSFYQKIRIDFTKLTGLIYLKYTRKWWTKRLLIVLLHKHTHVYACLHPPKQIICAASHAVFSAEKSLEDNAY